MASRPFIEEKYQGVAGNTFNFVVYVRPDGLGEDEVLQHKLHGVELAHITLHPGGVVNVRATRDAQPLRTAVLAGMAGCAPAPSARLQAFFVKVRPKL
ncbi:MAG TPA: hypothetical protein VIU64_15635 [Polyangia bacterium]